MRSNYRKLGAFIRSVNTRNSDLRVQTLLGVSIQKVLMPSIANTVGTNMKTYKIIKHNQFAYGPVTSRNGDKISIALLEDHDEAIISQVYTVFEVIDKDVLDPEYLMMWFRRPEFDRYARYHSHGSARETFDWEDMCEVELAVPSIEKQREMAAEYNTVVNRIKLNKQLNQKLEETAQAIYRRWFVEFEFPDENGNAYKSSGGKMVWNEELGKEVPEGWGGGQLRSIIDTVNGYAFKSDEFINTGEIAIVKIKNVIPPIVNLSEVQYLNGEIYESHERVRLSKGDILITMTGSGVNQINSAVGQVGKYYEDENALINQRVCKLKVFDSSFKEFVYQFISSESTHIELLKGSTGSANQANISPDQIKDLRVPYPPNWLMEYYQKKCDTIDSNKRIRSTKLLESLRSTLLSKMTQVEVEEKELA